MATVNHLQPGACGLEPDPRPACAVTGCHRKCNMPLCPHHWRQLASAVRQRILDLEDEWPTAHQVAVALAAEKLDARQPVWRQGWAKPKNDQTRNMIEGQHATWQRLRARLRKQFRDQYEVRVRPYLEEVADLQAAVGAASALEVALAVVRGGLGIDGFDPWWIAAGLDVDEDRLEASG